MEEETRGWCNLKKNMVHAVTQDKCMFHKLCFLL